MNDNTTTFKFTPGQELPNGATLLSSKRSDGQSFIVLAHWNNCMGPDGEFIVWRADSNGICESGSYVSDLAAATKIFTERS